jgi:ADP-ribose pyrophosphatase
MEKRNQTIASLQCNHFSVHLDEVSLKDGTKGKRVKLDHPEAAAIIPFVTDDEILMVKQYRYALGRETLEIPAGKMDPGESPEACAGRELLEETGYEAQALKLIYTYAPAIGYSNELIHIYSGHDLIKTHGKIDEREIDSIERVTIPRLKEMINKNLILDGKTLIGLSMMGVLRSGPYHFLGGRTSGG